MCSAAWRTVERAAGFCWRRLGGCTRAFGEDELWRRGRSRNGLRLPALECQPRANSGRSFLSALCSWVHRRRLLGLSNDRSINPRARAARLRHRRHRHHCSPAYAVEGCCPGWKKRARCSAARLGRTRCRATSGSASWCPAFVFGFSLGFSSPTMAANIPGQNKTLCAISRGLAA